MTIPNATSKNNESSKNNNSDSYAMFLDVLSGLTLVRLLKQADETYEWSNVDCKLHNILIGEMYIEQCGEQIVECKENGLRCRIRYLSSKSTERMHDIEGYLYQ